MEIRQEIIHRLREDACPIDGVDRTETMGLVELVICKESFDDILAVVERSFHGEVVNVRIRHGRHLGFLDRRDAALGMENEYRNIGFVPEAIDRCTAE